MHACLSLLICASHSCLLSTQGSPESGPERGTLPRLATRVCQGFVWKVSMADVSIDLFLNDAYSP